MRRWGRGGCWRSAVITASNEMWGRLRVGWGGLKGKQMSGKAILHHHWTLDQNTTGGKNNKRRRNADKRSCLHQEGETSSRVYLHKSSVKYSSFFPTYVQHTTPERRECFPNQNEGVLPYLVLFGAIVLQPPSPWQQHKSLFNYFFPAPPRKAGLLDLPLTFSPAVEGRRFCCIGRGTFTLKGLYGGGGGSQTSTGNLLWAKTKAELENSPSTDE